MFWRRRATQEQDSADGIDRQREASRSRDVSDVGSHSTHKSSEQISSEIDAIKERFAAKDYRGAIAILSRIVDENWDEAKRMQWPPAPHWYAELARAHEYLEELDVALAILDRYERDAQTYGGSVHAKITKRREIITKKLAKKAER